MGTSMTTPFSADRTLCSSLRFVIVAVLSTAASVKAQAPEITAFQTTSANVPQPVLLATSEAAAETISVPVALPMCALQPACCEDDCCGAGTSWHLTECHLNATSPGWTGALSNSDDYVPGCVDRRCCENDCCGQGTVYDADTASCLPDPFHNDLFQGMTAASTTTTTTGRDGDGMAQTVSWSSVPSMAPSASPISNRRVFPDDPYCFICDEGHELSDPDQVIDLTPEGLPPSSCGTLDLVGKLGFVTENECEYFRLIVKDCLCVPEDQRKMQANEGSASNMVKRQRLR